MTNQSWRTGRVLRTSSLLVIRRIGHVFAHGKRRCRPLMAFDPTISLGNGREAYFRSTMARPYKVLKCSSCNYQFFMRVKLRYILPMGQMILAFVTIWWYNIWIHLAERIQDFPGKPVGYNAVLLMNAPVSVARHLFYDLSPRWSDAMYVVSVGLLWYWVGLNMDFWYQRRTIVVFRWAPLRIATDLLLIGWGPYSVWQYRNIDIVHVARFDWPWFVPDFASCLVWGLGPSLIFGRDLVQCFRGHIRRVAA